MTIFVRQVDAFSKLVGFVDGSHINLLFVKFQVWCWSHDILDVNVLGEGIVAILVALEGEFDVIFTWSMCEVVIRHWHSKFCWLFTYCYRFRFTRVLVPTLYNLTSKRIFLLYICKEYESVDILSKPLIMYLRCGHLHIVDGEWSSTCICYGHHCIIHSSHLYQWVGVVGALVAFYVLYHDVFRPLWCCSTGNLYIHRECEVFATWHVGCNLQVGVVAACHALSIHVDSDIVGCACGKRQFYYRCELYSAVKLEHTFRQQDALRSIDIRNAGETEWREDDSTVECALILEAERTILLKNELIVNTHVHRVTIFDERDYGAVFSHVVECSGCLGLIHRM